MIRLFEIVFNVVNFNNNFLLYNEGMNFLSHRFPVFW